MDPLEFLSNELRQGLLLTRSGAAQDFRNKIPFVATDPVTAYTTPVADIVPEVVPTAPGQLELALYPPSEVEYRQGSLLTRSGAAQDFRRRTPFIATDPIAPNVPVVTEVVPEPIRVSPGQISLPIDRPNRYRAGATVRAVGADLADIPELSRFQQAAPMRRPTVRSSRMPIGGALVGLAAGLMDPEVARQLEANEPIEAAAALGTNVVVGGAVGDVVRNIVERATKTSPAARARMTRMAGILGPVALGAGLFMQGQSGSPVETALRKASGTVPGLKPQPETDIGKSAANEARYIIQSLIQGRMPYSR